jgi:flagellar biosynthesis chaperone FliJ
MHVQSRYEDVETRLQRHVDDAISKGVEKMQLDTDSSCRLAAVENQIQSLVDNQSRLEHWVTDGSSKVQTLQQNCAQLQNQVTQQGQTLQHVVTEVAQCSSNLTTVAQEVSGLRDGLTSHLDTYFAKQQSAIEALLAKRPRHD